MDLTWNVIYNVNMAAQANQVFGIGANVIDGRTWYAKGGLVVGGNTYTIDMVNGSGLSIRTLNTNATVLGSNLALAYPHWFLPFSQIPGFDLTHPIIVMARWNYDANFCYAVIGICNSTDDGVGLTAADRQYDHFVGPYGDTVTSQLLITKIGANAPQTSAVKRDGTSLRDECVAGVHSQLTEATVDYGGSQNLAAGMPADTTGFRAQVFGAGADPFLYPAARSNPGIFFGIQQQLGSAHGAYLEELTIFQLEPSANGAGPKRFDTGYWIG